MTNSVCSDSESGGLGPTTIDPAIHTEILARLANIEAAQAVRILSRRGRRQTEPARLSTPY